MKQAFKSLCFALFALTLAPSPHGAFAQNYPTKPIRLEVGVAAGGGGDIVARLVADKLSENLGQRIIVENKTGASSNIAADFVAKSPPDGYTLFFATNNVLTINPAVFKKLPFDPAKDFAPISLLGNMTMLLIVPASLPAHSVKELVDLAKSKPGELNYASAGEGATTHLTMELLKEVAGIDVVHVPYKGNILGMQDMLGGRVQMMVDGWVATAPYVKAGQLRYLGVAGRKRSTLAPDLPTIAEQGFPGVEAGVWYGILAPAGTPPEIINRLNTEIAKVMTQPDTRQRLLAMGLEVAPSSPEQFADIIRSDAARWSKVARDVGVKLD